VRKNRTLKLKNSKFCLVRKDNRQTSEKEMSKKPLLKLYGIRATRGWYHELERRNSGPQEMGLISGKTQKSNPATT
jgi:hypothetical protein